ncbi:hypothetical protein BGZ73_000960 [Actinomortierella ambigua]|nr:hypothetical protein BGZ73_000960 [Actinomortierella ambigua]
MTEIRILEESGPEIGLSPSTTLTATGDELGQSLTPSRCSSSSSLSPTTLAKPEATYQSPENLDRLEDHIEEMLDDPKDEKGSLDGQALQQQLQQEQRFLEPPNGGLRAWSVVAASFFIQTFTFVSEFMFGVFEHNYLQAYPGATASVISLIGTLASCTTYLTGFLSGYLAERYGYRRVATVGTFVMTASLVLASFSTQVWHLYLTQGIMLGFGASLMYYAAVGAPAHWFTTRRGLAMGISGGGSGVGGGIASLLLKEFKQSPRPTDEPVHEMPKVATDNKDEVPAHEGSVMIRFQSLVRTPVFQALVVFQFLFSMAYLTPVYYMEVYATYIGLSEQFGALTIGWFNGATVVSRIVSGILADRFSKNVMLVTANWGTFAAVMIFWNLSRSAGYYIAFALIYGVAFGAVCTMTPVMMADYYGPRRVSSILGIVYSFCSVALVGGVLISGYLYESVQLEAQFMPVIMFTAALFGVASIMATLWAGLMWRRVRRSISAVTTQHSCEELGTYNSDHNGSS